MRLWIGVLTLVFSLSAFAQVRADFQENAILSGFEKRFKIVRNDSNEVIAVKMKLFNAKFKIRPYLVQIKNDIKAEIDRMRRDKAGYDAELDEFIEWIEEGSDNKEETVENSIVIRDSLNNLPNIKVDETFSNVRGKGVFKKFEKDLRDVFLNFSLSILANTNDARFFYRRNVTYEVVKRALEFAKKKFDHIPLLNLASFIIVKVHDLILDQRLFHQNMLMHYLQNFPESKLGLTKSEADRIFSSIYESRISAINYWESNRAAETWAKYGLDKFYSMVRMANNKIRRGAYQYDAVNGRYNYAFVEVVEKGEKVVKNLVNNKHMLSGKSATAYNYAKPDKVRRTRALLNLGQVGLGFLPIPGWIKAQVDGFINSLYVEQKRTEGALVAYFESNGNQQMLNAIFKQNINPYLVR
jgi:hypothetical protein